MVVWDDIIMSIALEKCKEFQHIANMEESFQSGPLLVKQTLQLGR